MLEEREPSNFSSGCFINLCEIEANIPKRKNALPGINAQHELTNTLKEDTGYRKKATDCEAKARRGKDNEDTGNKLIESKDKQKRKHGVVIGVDPNVDAYLTRLKKLDETSTMGCNGKERLEADERNRLQNTS